MPSSPEVMGAVMGLTFDCPECGHPVMRGEWCSECQADEEHDDTFVEFDEEVHSND